MRLVGIVVLLAACSSRAENAPADGPGTDAPVSVDAAMTEDAPADAACTCEVAPPPRCQDATTLVTARAPGTCLGTACSFETSTSVCAFGCRDGACVPQACTPSCASQTCGDDGCGGTCGPCPTGTTYPGVTPVQLGIARDLRVAPDGAHVAALRPLDTACGNGVVGRLDVWTVPATGAATHRTIGAKVDIGTAHFTDNGYLVYGDNVPDGCVARADLWLARSDGSAPTLLVKGATASSFLRASPSVVGHTVFFQTDDPLSPPFGTRTLQMWSASLPGGTPRLLTRMLATGAFAAAPDGGAIWVERDLTDLSLVMYRADGSFVVLMASPLERRGAPVWAPDGKRLAYAVTDRRIAKTALYLVEAGQPVLLDADCNCGEPGTIAFSGDGAQLAWLAGRPFGAAQDAIVHRFAGGPDLRVAAVEAANDTRQVVALTFSGDGARLTTTIGNFIGETGELRRAAVAGGATAVSLGSLASSGLDRRESWDETLDGATLALRGADSTTRVVSQAGTQTIAGDAVARPRFEPTPTAPRLLVQHGAALSVFPTAGTGAGSALPGFAASLDLSNWTENGNVPFVFGWSGAVALYPAAVQVLTPFAVAQDVMAWTPAAQGRLAARVTRYRFAAARMFAITQDQGLFVLPRP